ncbi:protein prenylyltransferase [Stereum hirsutum FP-91666 SS1]|uniref:protein prenylyltransferase n=1 Tax=Stereum hirsutum (strain FP-91666) TaxID=721885 RepID=UPI000440CE3B|nr:protein prenylyltransferase [Stereum hirsutum FP-91666 SS1]EIM88998.1 protein prenylyltransferase [Stereum hirsutum FP-91666 SS1]
MPAVDVEGPTLFCERPEWEDVTPIAQYENITPLAPIFYSNEYKDATDYFRGILKTGEMSPRVLDLTEQIIRMNPAHYSAWTYRYQTLIHLQTPLGPELELTNDLTRAYLKTYQVWHHRRLLVTALNDPTPELPFIETILGIDAKNYHTWSYRQWLLSHFDREEMWESEVPFLERLVEEDVRNNSAWHHRFFVVFERKAKEGGVDEDVVKRELVYTKQKIALAPNNMSAWNYLRGVLGHAHVPYPTLISFVEPYTSASPPSNDDDVVDLENPLPSKGAQLPCPAAIEFLADAYEAEGAGGLSKSVELWKSLANEHDKIRKKYWEYRIKEASTNITK